jgi:ABC-2 type transport system ATP-binding protein
MVRRLRDQGVTIILTTHYIDEAEEMADRIGIISGGQLIVAEEKATLMRKLGRTELTLQLVEPMAAVPDGLGEWALTLKDEGNVLLYRFDTNDEHTGVPSLLRRLSDLGIGFKGLQTRNSSLEDIFVGLIADNTRSTRTAAEGDAT